MNQVAEAPVLAGRDASPAAPATFYGISTGDVYWRLHAPARAIGAEVKLMTLREANAAVFAPNRGRNLPWRLHAAPADGSPAVTIDTAAKWREFTKTPQKLFGLNAEFPEHQGAAVFTRPCLGRATLARAMSAEGVRTVAETDDNYFAAAKFNIYIRQQGQTPESLEFHAKAMASMDVNVFSTSLLRDRYALEYKARFRKQRVTLPEMHVCRNHLPSYDWPDRDERDGPLRVGFMGSNSHAWDVNIAYPAFAHAANEGCETWMVGYNPAEREDIPDQVTVNGKTANVRTEKAQHNLRLWGDVVQKHRSWVPSLEFRRQALPLDIGLCPLRADDFTLCKSDVKMLEYAASGAAIVAMNNPVFNREGWKHEVNCLFAGSPAEMAEQTVRLIRDPKLRFELVTAAQEYVASERNEHVLANEWKEALAL